MKIRAAAGIAALGISISGCASIIEGTTQQIAVATPPVEGAKCTLVSSQGTYYVTTPGNVTVHKSKDDLKASCAKEGFQDAAQAISPHFNGATAGNIIAGGLIGIGVDAATGANYNYPTSVTIPMAALPDATPATAPAAVTPTTTPTTTPSATPPPAPDQIAVATPSEPPPLPTSPAPPALPSPAPSAPPVVSASVSPATSSGFSYSPAPSASSATVTSLSVEGTDPSDAAQGNSPAVLQNVTAQTNVTTPAGTHLDIIPQFHFMAPNGNATTLRREVVATNGPFGHNVEMVPVGVPAEGQKNGAIVGLGFNCGAARFYVTWRAYFLDTDGSRSNAMKYTIHCNGG